MQGNAPKANGTFGGLQGTQRMADVFGAEMEQWSTHWHDIWDFRAPRRKGQPAGVMIMAPKGWVNYVRTVFIRVRHA